MKDLIIRLVSIDDVKRFVNTAVASPCDIYLFSGRYIVDGKSIMGVYSLDLSSNIRVEIRGNNAEKEAERFRSFEVEE